MDGMIFDIQHFSVHDGPGIRTTVFFKGCNLKCLWCHNPESQEASPQLLIKGQGCIACGSCAAACPTGARRLGDDGGFIPDLCTGCGKCASVCYPGVLEISGEAMSVSKVMEEIRKDGSLYCNSGGGVTFSGGEAMLQIDFLEELLRECVKHGIHTTVDTAGAVPWESFRRILPYTSLFLYDLKCAGGEVHRRATGADNRLIVENLNRLKETADVWIRIPCIKGINDSEAEREGFREILKKPGKIQRIDLLAYHSFGEGKYRMLGRSAPEFQPMDAVQMNALKDALDEYAPVAVL
ncbi:glycyl-radical enzyme activating protein [Diplocloster agilis]|uniref:Glycyl-radical enzyme activating protein n=1 Tax=Diplocloster agilis TaxID=2850323 RepID=A0A949JX99_9FIRM|nr:glycyl-radical enzyme activating protein [Diplocloster agilis]MBU9736319.1 glycyl-radical enzyme activating protein [Diplocloster agilis]